MKKRFFLTMEGPDGCGKTTQSKLLVDFLRKNGLKVIHTREPGGTSFAETVRQILLNPKYKILPLSELMLYEASRAQHTEEVIRPALKKGNVVVCERYTDATYAYQGYGRKFGIPVIKTLNQIATGDLQPDLTLLLDIPVEEGLRRARKNHQPCRENRQEAKHSRALVQKKRVTHPPSSSRTKGEERSQGDRLEQESLSFHRRVRRGYFALAEGEPNRIKIISAKGTIETIQKRVREVVQEAMGKYELC